MLSPCESRQSADGYNITPSDGKKKRPLICARLSPIGSFQGTAKMSSYMRRSLFLLAVVIALILSLLQPTLCRTLRQDAPPPEPELPEFCLLPSVTGFCKAYYEQWYYDYEAGECRIFVWGGCGGNENRFLTQTDCEAACMGS